MESEVMAEKPKPLLPHKIYHPPPQHPTSAGMIISFPPAYGHFLHSYYNPNPAAGHINPLLHPHYGRWCKYSHPGFPHHSLHTFFLFPLNSHYYYLPSQVPHALDAGEGYRPIQKMVDVGASVELGDAGCGRPVAKPPRLFDQLKYNQSPGGENLNVLEKEEYKICDSVIVRGPRSDQMITGGKHKMREMGFAAPPPWLRMRKVTRRRREAGGWFRIPREGAVAQWRPKKSSHASAYPPEDCGGDGGGDSDVGSGVKDDVDDDSSPKTSVMIKNIPNKLRYH